MITTKAELRAMLHLATPLVLSELGWMAMGVVDTMFVGRIGAEALGGVSLGTTLFYTIAVFASGFLLGMDTFIARAAGGGNREDSRRSLISGMWLAGFMIPLVMAVVWASIPLLRAFGENPAVLEQAVPFIHIMVLCAPPLMIFFAMRRYLQSVGRARSILFTLVTANLLNAFGNWVLIDGNLGAPRMGIRGSAWSTFACRVYMAVVTLYAAFQHDPELARERWMPDFKRIRELLKLGIPAAAQIGLETIVFAAVTMLMGKLSAISLAGHQIALTTVSTTFMMPLGISAAAAVMVGQAIGRTDPRGAAHAGWAALGFGGSVMAVAAVVLLIAPGALARLFTPDAVVIAAAVPLLRVAAFFQLFDGLQITATGALRGAGDTHTPMLCHLFGYWVIGLPLGWLLCFRAGVGAVGLWVGLSTGLIIIGIALLAVWRRRARRLLAQVSVGEPAR